MNNIDSIKLNNYNNILDLLPEFIFKLPHKKWIIPRFNNIELYISLQKKLLNYLKNSFYNDNDINKHIIENMIYMMDINDHNVKTLTDNFGKKSNIFKQIYFLFDEIKNPDIIVLETNDIWDKYIKHAIHSLNDYGHLLAIIPSTWLNKNHSMFDFLMQFHISYLHIDSNKTYFHLQKKPTDEFINIYDYNIKKYIRFCNKDNIPLYNQNFINKLLFYIKKDGYIFIKKVKKKYVFDEKSVKLTINNKDYLIPNINHNNVPFLNIYFKSNFVKYILFSFQNNILYAFNTIPNILQHKNKINNNIDQYIFQLFNLSIIDIDNITKLSNIYNIDIDINIV